jgi:hypothetical protein
MSYTPPLIQLEGVEWPVDFDLSNKIREEKRGGRMGRFVCPPTAVLYCTQQHHQTPSNKMKKIITIIIKKSKADASLSPLPVPLYSLYNRMNGLSSRGLVLWKEGKTTYTHTHDTTTTREREERNIIRQAQRNCTYQLK